MPKNFFKTHFFISMLILSLFTGTAVTFMPSHKAWAETPEEKAQKEADKKAKEAEKKAKEAEKKAAEQVKRIADWHKRAEENVRYKFDRFKKSTLVAVDGEKVRSLSEIFTMFGDLFLSPDALVPGEITKTTFPAAPPENVEFFFYSRAEKEEKLNYSGAKEVDFLVDGKPFGPYEVKYSYGPDGENILENMTAQVPYADFKKMANAMTPVEGRLGEIEFKFKDYFPILVHTFYTRISPLPSLPKAK